ncbi:MAG TPA: transposase [Rudaea sp.]
MNLTPFFSFFLFFLRLELPGVPMHLVQRGLNRAAVFIDDEDRTRYLELRALMFGGLGIEVHAYVLMTNHVHLLISWLGFTRDVSPRAAVCSRVQPQAPAFWHVVGRTVQVLPCGQRRYLLSVYRYIELNPVRAAMVADPEAFA